MRSKEALDKIIRKSRVHLYKPIQIAEILHHYRMGEAMNLLDLETYRNPSKKWRDTITNRLVGNISTSSARFQDNLFDENAMPPELLKELGEFNKQNKGIVESYIYQRLEERLSMVLSALTYIEQSGVGKFDLHTFLAKFTDEPGLKRSVDKAYEITVYALFSTLVRALQVEINATIKNADDEILDDFSKFVRLVLGLTKGKTSISMPAKLFRVGVTNAADRGLDMWANFGPAIQVKHISLSEELAEDVTDSVAADKIILICLDGEETMIKRITSQLPFSDRIQGIITLKDLETWYALCLSSKYKKKLGEQLLKDLTREFDFEFPTSTEIKPFLSERGYDKIKMTGEWKIYDMPKE